MKGIILRHITLLTLIHGSIHAETFPAVPALPPQNHTVTFDSYEDLIHAFHAASARAPRSTLSCFLRTGININERSRSEKTALHYAASESNWATIKWLLRQGAELEAVDIHGHTPLLAAANAGRTSNVSDLIEAGANIAHRNVHGASALDLAISSTNLKTVSCLLRSGASLEASDTPALFTPLHRAAKKGLVEITQALIDAGADVNAIAADKKAPIHYAAYSGNPEIITLLLDANADATLKDDMGRTPRDIAELFSQDHEDCVLCTLNALKIRHWDEAILRLRVAELPGDSKKDMESHLGLKHDEL